MIHIGRSIINEQNCYFKGFDRLVRYYSYNDNPVIVKLPNQGEIPLEESEPHIKEVVNQFMDLALLPSGFKGKLYYYVTNTDDEFRDLVFIELIARGDTDTVILGQIYLGEFIDVALRGKSS